MRHFSLMFFFFLSSKTSFCQTMVLGEVLEKVSRKPIPFANIGIINANIGTLSNVDGSFSLKVPEKLLDDSIVFSSLGFERKALLVRTLIGSHNTTVYLSERVVVLKEVTVHAKRLKPETFWLGNRSSRGGVMEEDTVYAGRSVSLLIDNRNPKSGREFPLYAQKARLRIFRNNLNSMRFRVRLNEMDEFTKLPGKDILEKNLIVESTIRSGWLVFDLSLQSVVVSKPFFLTFEQLTTREDRIAMINGNRDFMKKHPKNVKIDTVVFEGRKEVRKRYTGSGIDLPGVFVGISSSEFVQANFVCYTRETSFAEWKEVRGIVAATVLFSNQMPSAGRRSVGSPCNENTPECAAGKMCEAFLDSTGLNGLQLAVGRHGSIWRKSFGLSDAAAQVQVNDSTKFRIGSISKSMTSMALVKLFLGGKLDLDVSIQKYLPQFPKKKYGFTARQLAGHLAGFRDYTGIADYVHHEHYESALQALRVFEHDTLLFKPGSKFYYSTFGWSVLGAVIESICGKNYLTVMNESVFKPLGLKNTRGDNSKEKIFNRAKFYDEDGQENEFGDVSYKYAGGGLLSTSTDLVKFGYSMLRQGDTVKDILFTSQRTADGVATGYGFGWYVGIDKNGHRYWHHSGDGFSSSSHLLIYPDDDLVIAFLANGQQGAAFDIEALASYFLRK